MVTIKEKITMKEYQQFARYSCLRQCWDLNYLALGLCGEAGEVADKLKKCIREEDTADQDVIKELGDVLWYLTNMATYLGYDLSEVAEMNKEKLVSRARRGVIQGKGDDR